jgi:hypothetical protein
MLDAHLYYPTNGAGGSEIPPTTKKLKGRSLALKLPHLSAAHRAVLLADIYDGTIPLEHLTVSQLALLMGVSRQYAHAALNLTAEQRLAVKRKQRSLIQPKPLNGGDPVHDDIVNVVRLLGVERVLQAAVEVERSLVQA